ncbi:MAG: phytanoyl-CoA dioxygenase family protein [Acidimicrobiales bacterium]
MLRGTEIEQFIQLGYLRVGEAIPRHLAQQCREQAYEQLAIPTAPPWPEPVRRGLADGEPFRVAANAPRLLEAVGQLLEGEAWQPRPNLGLLVIRFPSDVDPGDAGWHIDASFEGPATDDLYSWYVNYRSTGRGLLLLCLLSDVGVDDAPTRILEGSHRAMPNLLRPFGEPGALGQSVPLPDTNGPTALATGQAGDVFLCHPFLVHAATWPHRGAEPRVIAQPPISLEGSLRIDKAERELSPTARAIRRALEA